MSAEVGQFALILALLLALVQSAAPLVGAQRGDGVLMALGRQAALLQGLFVSLAFGCLAYAYLTCDFSVALVAQHSHTAQPTAYRFAATWGSHEGSMLLWVLILALYGAGVAFFGGTLRETLQARVVGMQGVLGVAFLAFLIFTSNPFLRISPAPTEGTELNPLLQDPGLVMHPPLLYLGYVGFSVAFCFAVAALLEGRVDAAWARWVRPWVLAAWVPLTAGITLGSAWAYYELGWGGWWFWDPVENASFMPWLLGTALLHSALVLERRGALASWTILLAILTFSLSLVGTFLVRSGILTSVHAFAVDPQRGAFILALLLLYIGGARQANSSSEPPTTITMKARMNKPRPGSTAKAWTEVSTPERTRKAPSMEKVKAASARNTLQPESAPRFSVTMAECSRAVATSQGMKEAFSTGSQNHQPPQPSS